MINEKQKWPNDKDAYDRNYIRCFGTECPQCLGGGLFAGKECPSCNGLGHIEKEKPGKWKDCISEPNPDEIIDTNPGW